mmetsp:Transcript_82462/g.229853  ORF Transcript_82462/g.229853 Transcript_82462/m.229853 type:complete len:844 (-) Transcript_82462:71-2602(-)
MRWGFLLTAGVWAFAGTCEGNATCVDPLALLQLRRSLERKPAETPVHDPGTRRAAVPGRFRVPRRMSARMQRHFANASHLVAAARSSGITLTHGAAAGLLAAHHASFSAHGVETFQTYEEVHDFSRLEKKTLTGDDDLPQFATGETSAGVTGSIAKEIAGVSIGTVTDVGITMTADLTVSLLQGEDFNPFPDGLTREATVDAVTSFVSETFSLIVTNPFLGMAVTLLCSIFQGLFGTQQTNELQELYDLIMEQTKELIVRNNLRVKIQDLETEVMAVTEELSWVPEMLAAREDAQGRHTHLIYDIMIQHHLAILAKDIAKPSVGADEEEYRAYTLQLLLLVANTQVNVLLDIGFQEPAYVTAINSRLRELLLWYKKEFQLSLPAYKAQRLAAVESLGWADRVQEEAYSDTGRIIQRTSKSCRVQGGSCEDAFTGEDVCEMMNCGTSQIVRSTGLTHDVYAKWEALNCPSDASIGCWASREDLKPDCDGNLLNTYRNYVLQQVAKLESEAGMLTHPGMIWSCDPSCFPGSVSTGGENAGYPGCGTCACCAPPTHGQVVSWGHQVSQSGHVQNPVRASVCVPSAATQVTPNTCNNPNTCIPEFNEQYYNYDGSSERLIAVRCCSASGEGEGDVGFSCTSGRTWSEAKAVCESSTGIYNRLCTQAELESGSGVHSGCGFDNRYIWSSTPCEVHEDLAWYRSTNAENALPGLECLADSGTFEAHINGQSNTWFGELAEAKARCKANPECTVLHDLNGDGNTWRACKSVISAEGGQAHTMVHARSSTQRLTPADVVTVAPPVGGASCAPTPNPTPDPDVPTPKPTPNPTPPRRRTPNNFGGGRSGILR